MIDGLQAGLEYLFQVAAYTAKGEGDRSEVNRIKLKTQCREFFTLLLEFQLFSSLLSFHAFKFPAFYFNCSVIAYVDYKLPQQPLGGLQDE